MITRGIRVALAVAALVLLIGIGYMSGERMRAQGTAAQPAAAPRRVALVITQVKPEMIDAYRALVAAEAIPAEKKAGLPWRATYVPVFGDLNTFVTVRPITNYAQFDQPGGVARVLGEKNASTLLAKQRAMTVSARRIVQTLQPNLSIESGMTTLASLIAVTDIKLLPGKGEEWNRLITAEVLPAYKKAGVKDVWVHVTNFGGAQGRTVVQPITKFADIDGGISTPAVMTRGIGAEAAQRVLPQLQQIMDSVETNVLRLVPELSFMTPPERTSK